MFSSFLLKPGEWYLVATCEYCLTRYVCAHDSSPGKGRLKPIYQTTCPQCMRIGFHAASVLERYQHSTDRANDSKRTR